MRTRSYGSGAGREALSNNSTQNGDHSFVLALLGSLTSPISNLSQDQNHKEKDGKQLRSPWRCVMLFLLDGIQGTPRELFP